MMYPDAMSETAAVEAGARAAIYARISDDRTGDELGVKRQLTDGRRLAKQRGWTVAAEYVDNDISAYRGKTRPEYQRLLDDVKAGAITAVIAWHPDRLYRHPSDLEAFVTTVEAAGATVATVTAGELDLSTASGRMVARMLGAAARYESEHKAERQRRKARELAEEGKPSGGGDRPFGFERDRVTLVESEADEIRGAVRRIIEGATVRSILRDWKARGVTTTRGLPWLPTSFTRMLSSGRIAGIREHRGAEVAPAVWPAIVSHQDLQTVRAILRDPARRGRAPRRYLLTGGMARCGRCGAAMVARPNERGQRRYACAADFGGCNKTFHLADTLEDYVTDAILTALDGPALRALRASRSSVRGTNLGAEITLLEDRIREAARAYAEGAISLEGFQAADRDLSSRVDALRDRIARSTGAGVVRLIPNNVALRAWWDGADLDERRELIALVLSEVRLGPGVRGRNTFDPDRIALTWRV